MNEEISNLGFDHRLIESKDSLLSFREDDEITLLSELGNELPAGVMNNMTDDILTVG